MNNRFMLDLPDPYAEYTGETDRVPGDRYVPDPGRRIPITPEVLAEDAAKQAEREAARQHITWQPPAPVLTATYKLASRSTPQLARTPKPRRKLPHSPAQPLPKQQPAPIKRKRKVPQQTNFTIGEPIATTELPAKWTMRGRVSPYLSLYNSLKDLKPGSALPITVDDTAAGYAISQALRKISTKDKKKLDSRRSKDGKTFYFLLLDVPEEE